MFAVTFRIAPRRVLAAAFVAALTACASEREDRSWAAWRAFDAELRPAEDGATAAALHSGSGLADYLAVALSRNPALRAQAQRWRAGLERVPQARSLPDPQLSYGGFIEPVETRVGPQEHRLGVQQRIPWPGKLARRADVAFEEAEAARARAEAERWRVRYEVTAAYADYYVLARERAIVREVLALVRHWESVAQARLRTGARGAHRDVIKAQVEMGRLEDRLESLEDARRPRVERLRALLDLPKDRDLPWPQTLPPARLGRPERELHDLLPRSSPLLAAHDREVAARARGVDLAGQSYFPDFVVGLDYVFVGEAVRNAAGVRPRGSGDDAVLGKVGLSLPVWVGRNAASVSEARARLRAAELRRADTENALEAALARALYAYRDAERKLRLYRGSLIPKAEESLQATTTAYEAAAGDFLDVLDAERVLLEFQLQLERALGERTRALAELEMLTGTELSAP